MLTGEALTYYNSNLARKNLDFDITVQKIRSHFETEQQQQKDFTEWSTTTLATVIAIRQYIVDYEGQETNDTIDSDEEEFGALMVQLKLEEDDSLHKTSQCVTAYCEIDGFNVVAQLHDQSVHHTAASSTRETTNRYNSLNFQGIMIDTGAAKWSTA
ncbi:hypothetical protein EPUL_006112 [Erysiphe pulchra]|uniref:Uncharacterized protein n=1 Tax=Erysiphe pulchra TaxID=225359 RepID=A0A2S4PLY1_9PEZI|nr:hypothetical protein EPUL_006112 [Erysiphe pulchra]